MRVYQQTMTQCEDAIGIVVAGEIRQCQHHRQQHERIDFHALGDLATLTRFIEFEGRRLFGLILFLLFGHRC